MPDVADLLIDAAMTYMTKGLPPLNSDLSFEEMANIIAKLEKKTGAWVPGLTPTEEKDLEEFTKTVNHIMAMARQQREEEEQRKAEENQWR